MKKERYATIGLFMIAIIWGIAFSAVDLALANGWKTFTILACRGLISGLLLFPFVIKAKIWRDKKTMLHAAIAGFIFFLGYAFQTIGQEKSSVVNSAFFTCLYVIFAPFIALLFGRREVNVKTIIAAFIAMAGIFFLSVLSGGGLSFQIGDIFLVLCAVCFALQIIWVGHFLKENKNPIAFTSVMLLTMGIASSICIPIFGEELPNSFKVFEGVLFAAIFSSGVCSILQFYTQRHTSISKASLIMGLETPFACIFAVLIGIDKMNIYSIIGLLLMMIAVFVLEFKWKKRYDLKKYKYLLFDLDDTILDFKAAEVYAFKKLLKTLNIDYKDEYLEKYSQDNLALWKKYELGLIERKTIFEDRMKPLFEMLSIDYDPIKASYDYLGYLSESSILIKDSYQVLERLSKKYDLYIISNGEPSVQYPRIESADLNKFFKGLFISSEIGHQKPKKEFFDYVKSHIKDFKVEEALVIGDSLSSDIKGAIDYGIDSCWFNPNKKQTDLNVAYNITELSQLR